MLNRLACSCFMACIMTLCGIEIQILLSLKTTPGRAVSLNIKLF